VSRKTFFSFHYERDAWRAGQVRNSNVIASEDEYGFIDAVDWESIKKKGNAAIERWIDDQLKNTSVTVVLIGTETASREWVQDEILKSWNRGNGIVGIRIHNIKDQDQKTDIAGHNPLDDFKLSVSIVLSSVCKTYDWVIEDGRKKLGAWVDEAANIRAKYGTGDNIARVVKDAAPSLLRSSATSAGLSFPNKPVVPNKPAGFA